MAAKIQIAKFKLPKPMASHFAKLNARPSYLLYGILANGIVFTQYSCNHILTSREGTKGMINRADRIIMVYFNTSGIISLSMLTYIKIERFKDNFG